MIELKLQILKLSTYVKSHYTFPIIIGHAVGV